jgi:hypothetical protein
VLAREGRVPTDRRTFFFFLCHVPEEGRDFIHVKIFLLSNINQKFHNFLSWGKKY